MQFVLVFRIEVSRRFICKYDRWIVYKRPGYGHPLLFSSAQFRGLVPKPVRKTKETKYFSRPCFGLIPALACNICRNAYIFERREFGKQLVKLKDKADMAVPECRDRLAFNLDMSVLLKVTVPLSGLSSVPMI